jgi:hypothetical protein
MFSGHNFSYWDKLRVADAGPILNWAINSARPTRDV